MKKIFGIVASIVLIIVTLYPNLYLGVKQVENEMGEIDSLVDGNNDLVKLVGEHLRITGESPEDWIQRKIKWESDYNIYGNLEYWALPSETIVAGKGDCEDRAILAKSLNEYLQKKAQIVVQLDHVYLLKDGEKYFGVSQTQSVVDVVKEVILGIPFLRKAIILIGLVVIWSGAYYFDKARDI
ncbi:MAG: hypothetical protein ACXQTP_05945 [Candidatus Methanofastidiosia archaeon]